jgi:hypothetical protein
VEVKTSVNEGVRAEAREFFGGQPASMADDSYPAR